MGLCSLPWPAWELLLLSEQLHNPMLTENQGIGSRSAELLHAQLL